MAKRLPIRKTESILDELEQMHDRLEKRAYEIFEGGGHILGKDHEDWLKAEAELVWKPSIELKEKDNKFLLQISAPDVEPKDIDIQVTPAAILVKAVLHHDQKEKKKKVKKGDVHISEFASDKLFCAVHLPKKIDPGKVKAELKDSILHLTADIAEETQTRKFKTKAASK